MIKGIIATTVVMAITVLGLWSARLDELNEINQSRSNSVVLRYAEGYTEKVDELINLGILRYGIDQVADIPRKIVHVAKVNDARLRGSLNRFEKESFLLRDIQAANRQLARGNAQTVFRIRNEELINIDPYRHASLSPFRDFNSWQGSLYFRGKQQPSASLLGGRDTFRLTPLKESLRETASRIKTQIPLHESATGQGGESPIYFLSSHKSSLEVLAKVFMVGENAVIEPRNNAVDIFLNGIRVPQGRKIRIEPGDLLKIGMGHNYRLLIADQTSRYPTISSFVWTGESKSRTPKDTVPPFASIFARAMDQSFMQTKGNVSQFDVALTLDKQIHEGVQQGLENFIRRKRLRSISNENVLFRAGVTVMDALSGELLALASYPTPGVIPKEYQDPEDRSAWLRNQNFLRNPVGSVAKIPFMSAILGHNPKLAALKIPGSRETIFSSLVGVKMRYPIHDHAIPANAQCGRERGWLNLSDAIAYSSNRYAATLMTLGYSVDRNQKERAKKIKSAKDCYCLEEERICSLPGNLMLSLKETKDGQYYLSTPELAADESPMMARLSDFFDIDIKRRTGGARRGDIGDGWRGDDFWDTSMWRKVLESIYGVGSVPYEHSFYRVGLERENLAANLYTANFRSGFLSLILGGAESRWTNVKLAEVFSRVFVGQKIRATLVSEIRSPTEIRAPERPPLRAVESLGLDASLRRALLDGMAGAVVKPGATAAGLRPGLRTLRRPLADRRMAVGAYAKTGTPQLLYPVYFKNSIHKALQGLIDIGAIYMEFGIFHYRDMPLLDDLEGDVLTVFRARLATAIKANMDDLKVIGKISPRAVANILSGPKEAFEIYNTRTNKFSIRKGVTFRKTRGANFTFVIAVFRDADGRLRRARVIDPVSNIDQVERAYAVSIFLHGKQPNDSIGSPVAVEFAGELIKGPLRGLILRGHQ